MTSLITSNKARQIRDPFSDGQMLNLDSYRFTREIIIDDNLLTMKTCTSHTFNQYRNELSWTAKQLLRLLLTIKLVNRRDAGGSLCQTISEGSSLWFLDVGQDANTVGGPRARARATHEHDRLVRFEQTSIVSEAHGEHQSIVNVLFPLGCLRL